MVSSLKGIAKQVGRFLGKNNGATGVDIGSRFLKSVTLQPGRSSPILKNFSIETVTANPLNDAHVVPIKDEPFVKLHDLLTHPVSISVSGPQVLLKPIILPFMEEKDLREHLTLELDRYIPFNIQDVVWDIYRHEGSDFLNEEKQEVYLVIAKKNFIKDQIQQFEQQGVKISFIDIDSFALINMVIYNYGNVGTLLLVHLGPTGILFVILQDGKPVHLRQVSYEAEWYGDLLERVLLAWEVNDEAYTLGDAEMVLLQQFVQETLAQVTEFLNHLLDMSDKVEVQAVLLSGGYSMVEGLAENLADRLKISVNLVDPFNRIAVPPAMQQDVRFQKVSPLLGVAVGVALRGVISS
jgi:type IV pilus assembly protein PilM